MSAVDDLTRERWPSAREIPDEAHRTPPRPPERPHDVERHRRVLLGQEPDDGSP